MLHTPSRSPRDRRTLFAGASVVSAILIAGRGVPAWRQWVADERASAGELQAEHAAATAAVHALPALRDSVRARGERAQAALALALHAATSAAAGAALAERVGAVATAADVRLGALAIDVDGGGSDARGRGCAPARGPCLRRLRIRTDLTGDVRGVAFFLAALERGDVHVAVPQLALSQAEPGAPPTRAEVLHGTITLEALAVEDGRPDHEAGTARPPSPATPR